MTIKQASEVTGISVDNLRYYERIGLIPEVPRGKAVNRRTGEKLSAHRSDWWSCPVPAGNNYRV